MYIWFEDDALLGNNIWYKVSSDIKKEFDRESVYNKTILKTKIKSHGDQSCRFSW